MVSCVHIILVVMKIICGGLAFAKQVIRFQKFKNILLTDGIEYINGTIGYYPRHVSYFD